LEYWNTGKLGLQNFEEEKNIFKIRIDLIHHSIIPSFHHSIIPSFHHSNGFLKLSLSYVVIKNLDMILNTDFNQFRADH